MAEMAEMTAEDVRAIAERQGIPMLSQITTDHLSGDNRKWMDSALQSLASWVKIKQGGGSGGLLFNSPRSGGCSGYGVGKTHMSRAAGYAAFGSVLWGGSAASSHIVLDGVFMTCDEAMRDDAIQRLSRRKVLIIDDIGRETTIKYVSGEGQDAEKAGRYFQLIDHCYRNRITLIATTNLSLQGLEAVVGGATMSRIVEMVGKGNFHTLSGIPDYRPILAGWGK